MQGLSREKTSNYDSMEHVKIEPRHLQLGRPIEVRTGMSTTGAETNNAFQTEVTKGNINFLTFFIFTITK